MDNRIDRKLFVEIVSEIISTDGDKEQMTLTTEAQYQVKDGKGYLRYEESELSGMEGSKMLLKHDDGAVNIRRFGTVNSVFVVEIDKDYETFYRTPYGEFLMNVIGKEVRWNESDKLDIFISYILLMEGNTESSLISISIKEL